MRRVIGMAAFIGGLLLMALTAGMLAQREDAPAEVALVVRYDPTNGSHYRHSRVLAQDGREIWQQLPPESGNTVSLGTSPDGQWLYLRRIYPTLNGVEFNVERIRLDGLRRASLPNLHPYTSIFWSSDGQWMVYKQWNAQTGRDELWRASADGTQTQNLTPDFPHVVQADYPLPPILDPANAWVAFNAYDALMQVYRVDFPAGQVTQLTDDPDMPAYGRGHFRNSSGDWLVIIRPDGAYRMRVDGSEMTPLLKNDLLNDFSVTTWPAAGLLLIDTDDGRGRDRLYAVSMEDYAVRWSLEGVAVLVAPITEHLALLGEAGGSVLTVDAEGHTQEVAELYANSPSYRLAPDEQWVVVTMGSHAFAEPLTGGDTLPLMQGKGTIRFWSWDKDGQAVILMDDQIYGHSIWRVWLVDGRRERLMSYQTSSVFLAMGRLENRAFGGWAMMVGGGVILLAGVAGMMRRGKS